MNVPLGLYIGAGLDLKIIKNIPEVKNFVFIDSLPNSKFGIDENWTRDTSYIFSCICPGWAPFINTYSRLNFISDLKKTAIKEDFKLVSEEVNKNLKFEYKDQTIKYFVNTSIPHHLPLIKNDIKNFDHLIIGGFFPHHTILNHTTKNITFWGNTNTIYKNKENNCLYNNQENKDTVIYKLNNESLYEKKFKKFNVIQNNKNINCFRFWENFMIYTQYISDNKQ